MRRNFPVILLISLILLSGWQIADRVSANRQKLTLAMILTGLQTQGRTAETNTLAKRNVYIAKRVRQSGVTFRLTPEIESELRNAGATDDLIRAIRENSPPPLPTSTRTPTPIPTLSAGGREIRNSIGMEFVRIPAGTFIMGSPTSETGRDSDETQHRATISRDFYMGKYEVTQGQWKAVMGNNPSSFSSCGENCPVERVSWEDAQEFIRKLNARDGGTYRLPTEAEWEYAARAGTTTAFAFGDRLSSSQANFDGNYPYGGAAKGRYLEKTTTVGSYQPNAWGLYDMHGNVYEWCQDWYGAYSSSAQTDPTGATSGSYRVFRGSSWFNNAVYLRSACRFSNSPSIRSYNLGFRVVRQ